MCYIFHAAPFSLQCNQFNGSNVIFVTCTTFGGVVQFASCSFDSGPSESCKRKAKKLDCSYFQMCVNLGDISGIEISHDSYSPGLHTIFISTTSISGKETNATVAFEIPSKCQ